MDYSGKIIKKTPVTPSQTSASGVWTLDDAAQAQRTNTWPVANVPNPISRSLRFRSSASAYLSKNFGTTRTSDKIMTFSTWLKRGGLGSTTYHIFGGYDGSSAATTGFAFSQDANADKITFQFGGASGTLLATTAVYRDPSAWYHIVLAIDTTQATNTNRVKLYVNGSQVTSFSSTYYPAQNSTYQFLLGNSNNSIGKFGNGSINYLDGYMAETYCIDGQALDPTYFGGTNAVTGVWEPRQYTGTYGTNGFYLNFKDNTSTTTLGYDYSGNSNNWTTNNISLTAGSTYDSMLDVPTQWIGYGNAYETTRGNYATLNPLNSPSGVTLSSGNLNYTSGGSSNNTIAYSGISVSSGKWYAEYTHTTGTQLVGIAASTASATLSYPGQDATSYGYASNNGEKYNNGATAYGATWTANDVIGIALDLDAGTLTFYKNGTSQGTAFTGISGTYKFGIGNNSGSTVTGVMNFGQRPFSYTPPSGYLPLCTTNLSSPTILQGNQYMDVSLYTGNGSTNVITNSGSMQPDMVWVKSRSNAYNNVINDAVRGSTKLLITNGTDAEQTEAQSITSFNSNGFSLGTAGTWNQNGSTFVGWQWRASGSTVSNTSGSITSTVSANTTAGFSIVTYTGNNTSGATVGHGLGATPAFVIVKKRSGATNWRVGTSASASASLPIDGYFNLTLGMTRDTSTFQSFNSSTITLGNSDDVNGGSGGTYVAYCFASVAGYSAFGSYTGNGSSDGPFVYCGFRPRWILVKRTTASSNWFIWDTARNTYNDATTVLFTDANNADYTVTTGGFDIVSNGFKIRVGSGFNPNASGETYIFAAFAENPFKNALAR